MDLRRPLRFVGHFLDTLRQDVLFGFRVFASSPVLSLVAVVTLALGMAVSATVFGWIDAVLLHPYPGVTDTRGLALLETVSSTGEPMVMTSYLDYRDYRDNLKLPSAVAVARLTPVSLGSGGNAVRAWAELVSANYFDVLRLRPALGRFFLREEGADRPGAFPVAVISFRMWQDRYHGDPGVLGTAVRLNRRQLTIVGVAPPGFRGTTVGLVYDVWMPITMAGEMGTGPLFTYRGCRDLTSTLVRLKPDVTVDQARAEASALGKRLAAAYPETNRGVDVTVVPISGGHLLAQGMLSRTLGILMAVSALLLIIACANVANLLLSRAVGRRKEFALRFAFGAGRGRIVRQVLTETLFLALTGGAVGLVMVVFMGQALNRLMPRVDFPIDFGGGASWRTAAFTLLVVAAATAASGLAPALLSVRGDLRGALNDGGRSEAGGKHSHGLRRLLVAVEMALAMVALVGAGLFLRSARNASRIEPGFDATNVVVNQFYLSNAGYRAEEQWRFCRTLRERMEAVPGIVGVTYTDFVPLTQPASSPVDQIVVPGYDPAPGERMWVHRATVPPGYFAFMRIPLLEGRDFSERDEGGAPPVMIVNETFAGRYFRGVSAVGRTVRIGGADATVVAVVKDSKYDTPVETPSPYLYLPFRQWFAPGLNFSVLLRTEGADPTLAVPALRREALALNQDAAFHSVLLTEAIGYSRYAQTTAASLLSVVGSMCLVLAAVGLYGVVSYAVGQRSHEFGIRTALGASPRDIKWMVVREGLSLATPGLLAGVAVALLAARSVAGMLVGVGATDPLTVGGSALFLLAVTLLASYWPARRAVALDPTAAMRCR
jgi:predicted permease